MKRSVACVSLTDLEASSTLDAPPSPRMESSEKRACMRHSITVHKSLSGLGTDATTSCASRAKPLGIADIMLPGFPHTGFGPTSPTLDSESEFKQLESQLQHLTERMERGLCVDERKYQEICDCYIKHPCRPKSRRHSDASLTKAQSPFTGIPTTATSSSTPSADATAAGFNVFLSSVFVHNVFGALHRVFRARPRSRRGASPVPGLNCAQASLLFADSEVPSQYSSLNSSIECESLLYASM